MTTFKSESEIWFTDGVCPHCYQPYWVVIKDKVKPQGGFCSNCKTKLPLIFRVLEVSSISLTCKYCKMNPVFTESPGFSIFHIERGKVVRHMCDLKDQAKKMKDGFIILQGG